MSPNQSSETTCNTTTVAPSSDRYALEHGHILGQHTLSEELFEHQPYHEKQSALLDVFQHISTDVHKDNPIENTAKSNVVSGICLTAKPVGSDIDMYQIQSLSIGVSTCLQIFFAFELLQNILLGN